jgi:hypothetical protein
MASRQLVETFTVYSSDGRSFVIEKWATVTTGRGRLNDGSTTQHVGPPFRYETNDAIAANPLGEGDDEFEMITQTGTVLARRKP